MFMRIVLLALLSWMVGATEPLFTVMGAPFSTRDLILLGGGLFLIWKSTQEILELLSGEEASEKTAAAASLWAIVGQIIVIDLIFSLDSMLDGIESIVKHYKPHLNGERFLSNNEVSKKLNVSLRTLQEWRDTGLIPFIQIKGKIIYRQSDIDKLLQKHYFESWKE